MYAAKHDLAVNHVYSGIGHSQSRLLALGADSERGKLDTLLVYIWPIYLRHAGDLRTTGIAIHSITEGSLSEYPSLSSLLFEIALLDARRIDENITQS